MTKKNKKLKNFGWYALFVFPLLFIFATVVLIPFLIGVGYSFFSWDGLPLNPKTFVGISNFTKLFSDSRFLSSAVHTVIFTLVAIVTINVLGLGFALVVTTKLKVRNLARTMLFMPYLIGGLILGYIWKFIVGDAFAAIGEATGWGGIFTNWLLDGKLALAAMVVVATWQMAGYIMIIYITGIQAIPDDVIEAAQVDGATDLQVFWKIKWAQMMPTTLYILVITTINSFQCFALIQLLTQGGPNHSTDTVMYYIYYTAFKLTEQAGHFGYANAMGVVLAIFIGALSAIQFKLAKEK